MGWLNTMGRLTFATLAQLFATSTARHETTLMGYCLTSPTYENTVILEWREKLVVIHELTPVGFKSLYDYNHRDR